jgi:hypothetical protein
MSYPAADDSDSTYWYCPVCNDNGLIRGWQNRLWEGLVASARYIRRSLLRAPLIA